jgi:hypothetical protein
MAQVTILESMDATTFIESLSRSSPLMARHTSLVHIKKRRDSNGVARGGVEGMKYDWAHVTVRPWGEPMRAQCPECFSLRAWDPLPGGDPNVSRFRCKGRHIDGLGCIYILSVNRPRGSKVTSGKPVWISRPWPFRDEQQQIK